MAPVSPINRGQGVPGGLFHEPGTAHICRLRIPYAKNPAHRSSSSAVELAPHYEVPTLRLALRAAGLTLRALIPTGATPTQVSLANKTKRGLYVYQA